MQSSGCAGFNYFSGASDPNVIFKAETTKVSISATKTFFYELETLYSTTFEAAVSRRERALQSQDSPSASLASWQPPHLQSFGGQAMTLPLWRDYVASYLTDTMGGLGMVYVTSLAFDTSGHLTTQFMLVTTGTSGVKQEELAVS